MALNIQPPNLSGLTAIAGGSSGNLNLGNAGALGLQALQLGQQREAQLREAALEQMRLQQQGALGMSQQNLLRQQLQQQGLLAQQEGLRTDADLAFRQQAAQQTLGQNQADLAFKEKRLSQEGALGQAGIDVEKQKLAQEALKIQLENLVKMDKKAVAERAAFANYSVSALKGAKTPEEAQMIKNEIIKEAAENKYYSKDMLEQFRKAPISMTTNMAMFEAMKLNKASEVKAALDVNKEQSSGSTQIYHPETGKLIYSSTATKENVTKSQESYVEADKAIKQLEPYLNPPENFFGIAAAKHDVTYLRELGKSLGLGADQKDLDERSLYTEFNAVSNYNIMTTAKTLAGARFSDSDLLMIKQIMPQVGKLETKVDYQAKAKVVKNFLQLTRDTREEILKTGDYKIGTEEYDQEFSNRLPGIISKAQKMANQEKPGLEAGKTYNYNPKTGGFDPL